MAETSFPIEGQPLTSNQWSQVTQGFGQGMICMENEPYGIPLYGIDNANNSVRIGGRSLVTGDGRAIVSGFYHRFDDDFNVDIPAVKNETTYYLGLTYDPLKHSDPVGPVAFTVTTSIPSGSGKVYLPAYEITRQPNQLLTDAKFVDKRLFISPSIAVNGATGLPPAELTPRYTIATEWVSGVQHQVTREQKWQRITPEQKVPDPYFVAPLQTAPWDVSGGFAVTPLVGGAKAVSAEIEMRRNAHPYAQGDAFTNHGYLIPRELRGSRRGMVYAPAMVRTLSGFVAINTTDGQISARVESGSASMGVGDRISFSANWVVR